MGAILGKTLGDVAETTAGAGLGLLLEKHNDARQIRQQSALTSIQENAENRLADAAYKRQLNMWHETSYPEQVKMLQEAGLNPALMYGQAGAGGTTGSNAAGGVSGAMAPSGGGEIMGMLMQRQQLEIMKAQAENIKADTANKESENPNIAKTGAKLDAETASITQGIANQKATEALTNLVARKQEIENKILGDTAENAINSVRIEMQNLEETRQRLVRENWVDQKTADDRINIVRQQYVELLVNNALTRQQTKESQSRVKLNEAEIQNMAKQISLGWANWENGARNSTTGERSQSLNEYIRNVQESTKLSTETIKGIIQAVTLSK